MRPSKTTADICLVLEGTYPYVSGGVSTWVHQLISAYPDLRFAIFYLGSQRDASTTRKYEIPANVTGFAETFLFEPVTSRIRIGGGLIANWSPLYENAEKLCQELPRGNRRDFEFLLAILEHISRHPHASFETFWHDRRTWELIRSVYERHAPDESFLDFYWTCCFLVQPLWRLAHSLAEIPRARLYHTACTGYAGLAAALAAAKFGAPMLLTEHGIYLRERITDICRSQWIPDHPALHPGPRNPLGSLRRLWIGFFDMLGRMCYDQAGAIVSLFERNAHAQRCFGADPARISIIPNGVRLAECETWRARREERRARQPDSCIIGFLGRVVSIKDVHTLIRAARKVCDQLPQARFLVAGPTEEEPEYYEECLQLREQLGLRQAVEFTGPMDRGAFLPDIDLMILTSISEGLPFVILESLAAGIPVVSTDVGACREVIEGRPDESPPLGAAGVVAEVGAADALAAACVRLITRPDELAAMSRSGRARISQYYQEQGVLAAYRRLYDSMMIQAEKSAA